MAETAEKKVRRNFRRRKKVCAFCADKTLKIDYKEFSKLKRYVTEHAKIVPRRVSGACAFHQRKITIAIKRARYLAFIPYVND